VSSPLVVVVLVVLVLAMLDGGVRRAGGYAASVDRWPAGWRALRAGVRDRSPYRAGAGRVWVLVAPPGIPRATSMFLPAALGITLLWGLATVLALGDLKDVVQGTRSLPFVLASLALCFVRAAAGGAALLGAWERSAGVFFVAAAVALGLDVALACARLPCSDIRADDVHMALAGGGVQAALALGFAMSLWRRRGLLASARPGRPPEDLGAEELPREHRP
jgi:hypothetical protein